ncbi:MAG: dipeptide ABC transporter ATP-binding protein [Paracoccaceae bacterium]
MSILSIKEFNLFISEKLILNNISLDLNKGEVLGIAGESGSGKSMMALSILNLLPSNSRKNGFIYFENKCISNFSDKEMCKIRGKDISLIFQEPLTALNPLKTIKEQVAEPLLIHRNYSKKKSLDIATQYLEKVELPNNLTKDEIYPHEISGGQQQRVLIAKSLVLKPKIIIADEPTTSLDVITQKGILDLLKILVNKLGISLLLITHDLAVLAQCADRVAIMKSGEILETGNLENIFKNKKHPYTKKLLNAVNYSPKKKDKSSKKVILSVNAVSTSYHNSKSLFFKNQNKLKILNNLSFKMFEGEILGVVGESGSGKSTIVKTILGLQHCETGEILINNRKIEARKFKDRKIRSMMQVVFQDPYGSFNPKHRIRKLISEPFFILDNVLTKREIEERVSLALEEVGLSPSDSNKFIHEFSGGQRQRIAIARALITKPKLIILDEAVSSLDVSIKAQILDLLAELADKHTLTYLFISHDLSVVKNIANRVIVIRRGEIVEEGKAQHILSNPKKRYTKSLVEAIPVIPKNILNGGQIAK